MIKTAIPMTAVRTTGYAQFAALASELNWNPDFQPDLVEVDGLGTNGNPFELVAVTNFAGMESLKFKQKGAYLFLTVLMDETAH